MMSMSQRLRTPNLLNRPMRARLLVIATIAILLFTTQSTVANPGGEGDGNRDFTCGGSCHGDPSFNQQSSATVVLTGNANAFAGTTYQVDVTVSDAELSSSRLLGVFLLSSQMGNDDNPKDHGWNIIQDPNGGSANYIETIVPSSGTVTVSWVLNAPEQTGQVELLVEVNHGADPNQNDRAFVGASDSILIEVGPVPANLPGFALDWSAPNTRVTGDTSALLVRTQNATDVAVEWKLEGESTTHTAVVEAYAEDEWLVHIPATMGDTRVVYQVTTSNGEFDVLQPWLTLGTRAPDFDGTLWGARFQGAAGGLMLFAFIVALQGLLQPPRKRHELDHTAEVEGDAAPMPEPEPMPLPEPDPVAEPEPVAESEPESVVEEAAAPPPPPPGFEEEEPGLDAEYLARLQQSEEHPGWLWDPVEEEWVEDPNVEADS